MFETLEKVELELYRPCRYLTLKNVITLGTKKRNGGERLDPVYVKPFASNKYSDRSELLSMSVRWSNYLVLSYSRDDTFEEIYVSYPNLKDFKDGLLEAYREYVQNYEAYFVYETDAESGADTGKIFINGDYEGHCVKIENMASGKSFVVQPDVVEDSGVEYPGVGIILGREECYVQMSYKSFENMVFFLTREFNLHQSGLLLMSFAGVASGDGPAPASAPSGGAQARGPRDRKVIRRDPAEIENPDLRRAAQEIEAESSVSPEAPPAPTGRVVKRSRRELLEAAAAQQGGLFSGEVPGRDDDDVPF